MYCITRTTLVTQHWGLRQRLSSFNLQNQSSINLYKPKPTIPGQNDGRAIKKVS